MKFLKSRLLLTVLAPLVFSLSYTNTANAGTIRYTFRNGGYIDLTCTINNNNNQFKVIKAKGQLGNISSANLAIVDHKTRFIKKSVPVAQNGNVDVTKTVQYKNLPKIYLIGSITHSDSSYQKVYGSGTFCN